MAWFLLLWLVAGKQTVVIIVITSDEVDAAVRRGFLPLR